VQGEIRVLERGEGGALLASLQRRLADHVRSRLGGSPGAIAAAFASGDRGSIDPADEQAMRDSGLSHLLSISGLHVSAGGGSRLLVALRLLALSPWLALRVRLPLVAAAIGALAGVGYTLLTGAEVPTVRSCVGAVLVLVALALGREPLSLRMVAVAAIIVLILWPEALVGPSFQMSFAAVIAIVALHGAKPVRNFLAPREEGWAAWTARRAAMLLLTGIVIELALMPIVLFHFHRAGIYGALANVDRDSAGDVRLDAADRAGAAARPGGAGRRRGGWRASRSNCCCGSPTSPPAARRGQADAADERTRLRCSSPAGCGWRCGAGARALLGLAPARSPRTAAGDPVPDLLISGDGRHVGITGRRAPAGAARDAQRVHPRQPARARRRDGEPVRSLTGRGALQRRFLCDRADAARPSVARAAEPQP
jgi:competence protein ComEC